MDKPRELELLEKFVRAEHKLGKSQEDITAHMTTCVRWWVENLLEPEASGIERAAIEKIGGKLIDAAVAKHVDKVLNTT